MGHARGWTAGAVVRDRFAEDRGIDQGLAPNGSRERRSPLEGCKEGGVRNQAHDGRSDCAHRVVHPVYEERLGIGKVAG